MRSPTHGSRLPSLFAAAILAIEATGATAADDPLAQLSPLDELRRWGEAWVTLQPAPATAVMATVALGREALASVDHAIRLLQGEATRLLAQGIRQSKADALAAGTSPVPAAMAQRLAGHFPPDLIAAVRYRVGPGHDLLLPGLGFRFGDADAITLDDVIVFRGERHLDDLLLWAHELVHVEQYRRWGIDEFASRYVADQGGVEREAIKRSYQITFAIEGQAQRP